MHSYENSRRAFEIARARESVAAHLMNAAMHVAIYDAKAKGMSIRETARDLRLSKSTVARHWKEDHSCSEVPPVWGTTEEWIDAHHAVWKHVPEEDTGAEIWRWTERADGTREVTAVTPGVIQMRLYSDEDVTTAPQPLNETTERGQS